MKIISILILGLLLFACHPPRVNTPGVDLIKIPGKETPVLVIEDISEAEVAYRDKGSQKVFVFNSLTTKKNKLNKAHSVASRASVQSVGPADQCEGYCDGAVRLDENFDGQFVLNRIPGRIAAVRVGKHGQGHPHIKTESVGKQGSTARIPTANSELKTVGVTPTSTTLSAKEAGANKLVPVPVNLPKESLPISLACPGTHNPCALSTNIHGVIQAGCGGGYTHLSAAQVMSNQVADCRSINPETGSPFATNYDVVLAACEFSNPYSGIGQPGLKFPEDRTVEFLATNLGGMTSGTLAESCNSDGSPF